MKDNANFVAAEIGTDIFRLRVEFYAIEAVGEVEDPAVLFDSGSYSGSIRFLIIRAP